MAEQTVQDFPAPIFRGTPLVSPIPQFRKYFISQEIARLYRACALGHCGCLIHPWVMLKITALAAPDSLTVLLRVEGQVAGPWVEALRRAFRDVQSGSGDARITLDLSGVSFIDADGVALFHDLTAERAELTNRSVYVAERLKEVDHGNH